MAQCYCMHLKDPKLSRFNVEFNFNKSKGGGIYPFARYIGTTAKLMVFYWQYQMF